MGETLDRFKGACKTGRHVIDVRDRISELVAASSEEVESINSDGESIGQVGTPDQVLHIELVVQRTFICAVSINSNDCMVTASTTDAHSASIANPRRKLIGAALDL